jgi:hypothetical protein
MMLYSGVQRKLWSTLTRLAAAGLWSREEFQTPALALLSGTSSINSSSNIIVQWW